MPLAETLQSHADACDAVHQLMLDENRHLKGTGRAPDESLLLRKRAAVIALTGSLDRLRVESGAGARIPAELKPTVEKTQQIIMKTLLLDRENEQLLLKTTVAARPATPIVRPAASQLQRAYRS